MKSKIDSCFFRHRHNRGLGGFFPDRLIRVDQDKLSLVLTKDAANTQFRPTLGDDLPLYTALTYCWGPSPHPESQLKTTKGSLLQYQNEIPFDELPQAVRDAVRVTRALSIPYLWVDALCIIQDLGPDWDHQCAQMEKIYGSAHFTICALASKNCEEGFVDRRDKTVLTYSSRDAPLAQGEFAVYRPSRQRTVMSEIINSDWTTRGWTFQERLASNRMILFGLSNVHFRCLEMECSMTGDHEPYEFGLLDRSIWHREQVYLQWYDDVVAEFTLYHFEFTRATDVFPSIAGFAAQFADKLQDRYVAGLWVNDLHRGLYWRPSDPRSITYRSLVDRLKSPAQYISPSWSWASQTDLVSFEVIGEGREQGIRSECTILDTAITLRGTSPFGALTGGYLDISARVYPGSRHLTRGPRLEHWIQAQQVVQVDGRYLLYVFADCGYQGFFERHGEKDELCAPVSFLVIGSKSVEFSERTTVQQETSIDEREGQEDHSEGSSSVENERDEAGLRDDNSISASSWGGRLPMWPERDGDSDSGSSWDGRSFKSHDREREDLGQDGSGDSEGDSHSGSSWDGRGSTSPERGAEGSGQDGSGGPDGGSSNSMDGRSGSGSTERDAEELGQGGGGEKTGGGPNRLAYGLLIHPAGKPGEFHRIGTFRSECKEFGGLSFFDSCEMRTIRLV